MLNIVLYQPEIPENTGNISRSCVGFNAKLHLIRPYGFIIDDKRMKRAGLDYWDKLSKTEYDDWNDFESKNILNNDSQLFLVTKFGKKSISELNLKDIKSKNIFFIFGR
ncbi:MAG: tRNA (uridine(34)/cytosine(34)/5-carboxymethylaminomethyluridine(34)-2'-O)-methyltransferase TrmL, partial [Malacoplasma sp.]|nr:tRNA (uridine(34)/cytosine(34)/5-carboxymethylaminomethyluridine(34)-2'-O)-methyltransferase TrmL [Malacoplasma sp.]